MTNIITGHSREQVLEAHTVAGLTDVTSPVPQGKVMVTVLSLVEPEHQEYVRKEYSAVAVEIDGVKFMLTPSQLVPEGRTKILPSKVRTEGNPVPAGFGVGAGGEQVIQKPTEVKMKNNTLHKQLKGFQDMWMEAELSLFEHKLVLAEGASGVPENYESVKQYVDVDLKEMITELKEKFAKVDAQRKHIQKAFPYSKQERDLASTK